jgi:hypothetical protein
MLLNSYLILVMSISFSTFDLLLDMQSSIPVQEKVPSPAVSGLRVETKTPAPMDEVSLEVANGVKALIASDATPESASSKHPRSPAKSPLMKDNAEKPPIPDQGPYPILSLCSYLYHNSLKLLPAMYIILVEQTNKIL